MSVEVRELNREYEDEYTKFVLGKRESLMYYDLKFRAFLSELLGDASEYLIAVGPDDSIVGCLPVFFREDNEIGIVANSLPYYGGHGGPLANDDSVRRLLLAEYMKMIKTKGCVSSTIVGSPLEDCDSLFKELIKPEFIDERIELMTYFPYGEGGSYADALMSRYHHMERRCIRKAMKNEVFVRVDNTEEAFDFLFKVHTENMLAIGGLPKIKKCFELIQKHFIADIDYDLYIATKDKKNIAALLLFYYNGTVEYYTPAIVEEYRTIQPLTLIIYTAMQDAMNKGFEKWNWGGTGLGQKSLYDFKTKWGTTETRYYYYTKIWDQNVLQEDRGQLMRRYSNYFVFPFNQVRLGGEE